MITTFRRRAAAVTAAAALAFGLASCAADDAATAPGDEGATETIRVEDNQGTQTITLPLNSVISTDNRTFRTLEDWGVELSAAPVGIMPDNLGYKTDDSVVDLGNHREPDLEAIVAAEPDLIINGQRFAQYYGDIKALTPDTPILDVDVREGEPFDEELRRQTRLLGQVFGKEDEADELIAAFDDSIQRAKDAYNSDDTVMGVITSGGNVNYAAPGSGRTLGPVFDILGLTPALEVDNATTDHQGDDISVEAIADANPDIMLVMDRDAAVGPAEGEEYVPANELLRGSAALRNVSAVTGDRIIYMPRYTYLDEGIQTYTEFFNALADALERNR